MLLVIYGYLRTRVMTQELSLFLCFALSQLFQHESNVLLCLGCPQKSRKCLLCSSNNKLKQGMECTLKGITTSVWS